jgi:uncharacterized membrane protein YwzB
MTAISQINTERFKKKHNTGFFCCSLKSFRNGKFFKKNKKKNTNLFIFKTQLVAVAKSWNSDFLELLTRL